MTSEHEMSEGVRPGLKYTSKADDALLIAKIQAALTIVCSQIDEESKLRVVAIKFLTAQLGENV